MPKPKKVGLVLLAYSDSEHEDEEDQDQDGDDEEGSEKNYSNDENEKISNENNQTNNEDDNNESLTKSYFEDVYGDRDLSILEFHQSLLGKNQDEIQIPPPTKLNCSEELQNQIETLYEKVKDGYDLNKAIQKRKSMRNPSIYEKMISYLQIDEMATNYPEEIYNPKPFLNEESYYEELAKIQKDEMEKREKERKEQEKNNLNSSTSNKRTDPIVSVVGGEKKSKWDSTVSVSGKSSSAASSNHSAAIAAALAAANKVKNLKNQSNNNNNLTKPTVISAFGTISKKK